MKADKILLMTPDFPPLEGGVARYLSALATHFQGRIEVFTNPHSSWQSYDSSVGYPIYRLPLLYRWIWPRWLKIVQYLWSYRSRYNVVLTSHVLPFGTAAMLAKLFTRVPYIVCVHGMDLRLSHASTRKRRLSHAVLKRAQLVVANSHALAQEIAQVTGLREILVVYPCVPPREIKRITKIPDAPFTLLTVGRLVERKGHACVLNALSRLRDSGELPSFEYHIIGEGPLEATLRSMATTLRLDTRVVFHGRVNDEKKWELYSQADVFVMPVSQDPLDKEGFGLVFIEAAQAGVPSISTSVPGVDEAILDEQTGILLRAPDEQELAQAILYLYHNPSHRHTLGAAAQEHAKQFLCDVQMSKLDAYL